MLVLGRDFETLCTVDLGGEAWSVYDRFMMRCINKSQLGCVKLVKPDILISHWKGPCVRRVMDG